ncbi:MAG: molybdate ABC transporter substrate-binding protein, partial [Acidimicrobiia bacterium]|nr:molybdate ABC transporter substrate-binding protein [Acidimicrobiia bacterium]
MRAAPALAALLAVLPSSGGCGDDDRRAITVFAAASLTDAFTELAADFEDADPEVSVELHLAASSTLREQILDGAPADVFAPADTSTMDQVVAGGAVAGAPRLFARNALEIAVPIGNPAGISSLADFGRGELLLGLCAEEVPCGRSAREALARVGVDPAPDTDEPDVRSLLTKVAEGELDAGVVYRTDVLADDRVEGIEIPADQNVVIDYPIATLAGAGEADVAADFVAFVLGPEGRSVLAAHAFA